MSYLIGKEAQRIEEDGGLDPYAVGEIVEVYEIQGHTRIKVKTSTFTINSSLSGWVIRNNHTTTALRPPFPGQK